MIIAYAGVQADEDGRAVPRLPASAEAGLAVRLRGLFSSLKPRLVVGALASGSDLLIAEEARRENCEVRAFLPCDISTFRRKSVATRGSKWEHKYDRIIYELGADVVCEDVGADSEIDFRGHNVRMLDAAQQLAQPDESVWALIVRPPPQASSSLSDDFAGRAEGRKLLVIDIDPLAQRPKGFVAMSYGKKFDPVSRKTYDCDPVFHKIYLPLLEDLDVDWTRADLQTDSGLIHVAMVSDLANSRIVIADLSTSNFNVGYELGLRHVFAPRSTVLVNPRLTNSGRVPMPFDVGIIRAVGFERGINLTDRQAEAAIRAMRPVLTQVLAESNVDSPIHEWFDVSRISGPFVQRTQAPAREAQELALRERVKKAIRSCRASEMLTVLEALDSADIAQQTRLALRVEIGAALLDEGEYAPAANALALLTPPESPALFRTWLQKTAMVHRRLGDEATERSERDAHWLEAEGVLQQLVDLGCEDSETYGITAGLAKKRLLAAVSELDDDAVNARLLAMQDIYRRGFDADPSFYTGINLVMLLRVIQSRFDDLPDADEELLDEAIAVTRFLARVARAEDPGDFWAAATAAELRFHEAMLSRYGSTVAQAALAYAKAGLLARPEHLTSAINQLEFLRAMGDPADVLDRMIRSLRPGL
jgi:MAP3K TRAFs-binding domain